MVLGDSLAQLLSKSQGFDAFRILLFPFALLVGQLGEGLSSFCIFTLEQVTILRRIDCSIQAAVFLELHLLEGFGRESCISFEALLRRTFTSRGGHSFSDRVSLPLQELCF